MDTNKREILCEMGYEDSVVFENPDYENAIIGVTESGEVVYDYDLMVECLANEDDMTYEDAMEFIDYNTIRSLPYAHEPRPIIMYHLME